MTHFLLPFMVRYIPSRVTKRIKESVILIHSDSCVSGALTEWNSEARTRYRGWYSTHTGQLDHRWHGGVSTDGDRGQVMTCPSVWDRRRGCSVSSHLLWVSPMSLAVERYNPLPRCSQTRKFPIDVPLRTYPGYH